MPDYEIVTTERELNGLCQALSECPRNDDMNPLVLDVETCPSSETPLMPVDKKKETPANDRFTALLVGMSISCRDNQAWYIPLKHNDGNNLRFDTIVDDVEIEMFRRLLPYLMQWQWANHLERFDWGICKQRNVFVNYRFCSYIEAMLTGKYFDLLRGEEGGSDAGLKSLVLREFGYAMRNMDQLAKFHDGYHIERVPAEDAAWYACDDANYARKLHRLLYPQVKDNFLWQVEMSCSHLTELMEENGIPFNPDPCRIQLEHLQKFVPVAREVIYAQVERQLGRRLIFDIGNPNAIRELFFESDDTSKRKTPIANCLKLPIQKKSRKTKQASTDAKSLDNLAKDFEIVHNVLVYRKIAKAEDSFLSTLPEWIHPHTGKIHSTFHQGGVPAGRYASSDPNAQNWSEEKEYIIKDGAGQPNSEWEWCVYYDENTGKLQYRAVANVKDCVECDDDELLISADYRQAEFWGACELAKEEGMLRLIQQGHDPHTATASLMWGVPILEVPKALRKKGKTRNFAMLFGETVQSAAAKEGIPVDEMRELEARHHRAIPRVVHHREQIIADARRNHSVKTYFGRLIDLSQLYEHPDRKVQEKGDRLAYNAVIQGSFTGDMPKIAMVRCMTAMRNDYPNYPGSYNVVHIPLIHNGHDALTFRLTPKIRGDMSTIDLPKFVSQLRTAMEIHPPGFMLAAQIDITVGRRLGTMITIHDSKNPYAGQTAEDVNALILKKEVKKKEAAAAALEPASAVVLKLQLQGPPTQEQALQLKALLTGHPGNNVVNLNFLDPKGAPQSVMITKFPTSLGVRDAEKFGLILPCRVLAENPTEHLDFMASAMETVQ